MEKINLILKKIKREISETKTKLKHTTKLLIILKEEIILNDIEIRKQLEREKK